LASIAPLWHKDPVKLIREIIELGFHVIVTGVYAYGLDQRWLGRTIDFEALEELVKLNRKFQLSIVGEGGEYETLVLDTPYFKKELQIVKAKIEELLIPRRSYRY